MHLLTSEADDVDEAAETVLANALFVASLLEAFGTSAYEHWRLEVMSYLLAALPAAPTGSPPVCTCMACYGVHGSPGRESLSRAEQS